MEWKLIALLCLFQTCYTAFIANDVSGDYAQVKALLNQFYRRAAQKAGQFYDENTPTVAKGRPKNDGTEAYVNRNIWRELFENDIILNLRQAEALLKEGTRGTRGKRQLEPTEYNKWPLRNIPYEFNAGTEASWQNVIRSALRHISQQTCFSFTENGSGTDGLKFYRGSGCWSNVGRQGGRQLISLGYGCEFMGIAAHETLHALGLWHEQSRDDRDYYISLNTAYILSGTIGNFAKRTPATSDNLGQPYDLGSVMHYGGQAFTSDWDYKTITTNDNRYQQTIGQREGISFKDAKMINIRYCTEQCTRELPCENGGYTDPLSCGQCRCPTGYGGTYCNQVEYTACGRELTATGDYQTLDSGPLYANSNCAWRVKMTYYCDNWGPCYTGNLSHWSV